MMTLKDTINAQMGGMLALAFARTFSPGTGQRIAARLGDILAGFKGLKMVQAVRANQWVIGGGQLSAAKLTRLTHATFRERGQNLYNHLHYLDDPKSTLALVEFDPNFESCIERSQRGKSGQLLLVPHVSNYDLIGRAAMLRGINMQVLSYPRPPATYRLDNRMRQLDGMEVTPISLTSIRQAIHRLQQGGTVLTGVDRPTGEAKERPLFFGRPANLPAGYVRMALKAGVPVVVISGYTLSDGRCRVWASDPIIMQPFKDRVEEEIRNAEVVLKIIEQLIRKAPEQWLMFFPVWPETLQEIPY